MGQEGLQSLKLIEASGDFGTKNGVSIVFEETGYSFENGIYIDVSGKRVEFTKGTKHDGTYVLDVPEPLKQEWNLLESVYERKHRKLIGFLVLIQKILEAIKKH